MTGLRPQTCLNRNEWLLVPGQGSFGRLDSPEGSCRSYPGTHQFPSTGDWTPIRISTSNQIVATGHATLGMTHGPITGKLVAQLACGKAPDVDPAALSPDRF